MEFKEIIDNLNDLIDIKNTKIEGYRYAVEHLKKREKKALRELTYLKGQYDSQVERAAIDNAINVVNKVFNNE